MFRERLCEWLALQGPLVGGNELYELLIAVCQLLGRHSARSASAKESSETGPSKSQGAVIADCARSEGSSVICCCFFPLLIYFASAAFAD